jgi:hypothetical protein
MLPEAVASGDRGLEDVKAPCSVVVGFGGRDLVGQDRDLLKVGGVVQLDLVEAPGRLDAGVMPVPRNPPSQITSAASSSAVPAA